MFPEGSVFLTASRIRGDPLKAGAKAAFLPLNKNGHRNSGNEHRLETTGRSGVKRAQN
jgi:hypothetical protein